MERDIEIERYIEDAIIGRPYAFSTRKGKKTRRFYIYPATLGKIILLQHHIERLGINLELIKKNMYMETLRLATEKKDDCITIICYHTCKGKAEVLDIDLVRNRCKLLKDELSNEDIATLMVVILSADKLSRITKYLGIDKEQERLSAVSRVKDSKNSISFGGKSQYGSLIDAACERYGWNKEYVVWGIDYISLRLMLMDKITSVFLSDDELKKVPPNLLDGDVILPTAENMEQILNMDWR